MCEDTKVLDTEIDRYEDECEDSVKVVKDI